MSRGPRLGPLYKILPQRDWDAASGAIPWADIDRSDGFIHLSAAHQVRETAAKHFADVHDLCLIEVDVGRLDDGTLRWETSRGGDEFPHVYGEIGGDAVVGCSALPWIEGSHQFARQVPLPLCQSPLPGELALRLERAEASMMLGLGRAAKRVLPDGSPATLIRGSAVAAYFEEHSPLSAFKGWGVDGAPVAADLLAAETMLGDAVGVEISSHADPETLVMLAARGYRAVATENVLFRALGTERDDTSSVSLVRVAPQDAEAWGRILVAGFTHGETAPPELSIFGRLTVALAHTHAFFIVVGTTRVGACSMRFDHELAMMNGSSILVEHRGQGYHRAAIEQRLRLAKQAGCRFAKLDVEPGSTSHRNAHRSGFQLSHTRTTFTRPSAD